MIRAGGRGRSDSGPRAARTGAVVVAALLLTAACTGPAAAQLPYLDPLPVWTPSDSLAVGAGAISVTRLADGRTGWTCDRLLVEGRVPFGRRACAVLRLPFLRQDNAGFAPADRWPGLLGPGTPAGWPGENVTAGFGQAALGVAGPLALPLFGPVCGALVAGIPVGNSRAYPWSSAGLPAQVGLTRWFGFGPGWWLGLGAEAVTHAGPGRQEFSPEAFPDGWSSTLSLERAGPAHGWRLACLRQSRGASRATELAAAVWVPWQAGGRLGLQATREITGSADRAAAWSLGLAWRWAARPPGVGGASPSPAAGPTR